MIIGPDREETEYMLRGLVMSFFPHREIRVDMTPAEALLPEQKKERLQVLHERVIYYDADGREYVADYLRPSEVSGKTRPQTFAKESEEEAAEEFAAEKTRSEEKREQKVPIEDCRALERAVFEVLSRATGISLPWGILTGVRPTKLPMAMLREGLSETEIRKRLEEEYRISPQKAATATDIARREAELLKEIDYKNGYSLYIGIPFCPSICLYCSFSAYPLAAWKTRVDDYLDALEREMIATSAMFKDRVLQAVYVGGGTPTSLSPTQLTRLCAMVHKYFDLSCVREFTIEAGRPDSMDADKLYAIKEGGADRISVNPQSMQQRTLDLIGRKHRVEQVEETFYLARKLGFSNINMDIILGLPGETEADVKDTLEKIAVMRPDDLTVHSLAIKRAARLNIFWEQFAHMEMKNSDATMDLAYRTAGDMGMCPYYLYRQKNMAGNFENVGFATPGKEGLYNILIMEEVQSIVALGAGASTKAVFPSGYIDRCENVKEVGAYIERIDEMIERKRRLFLQEDRR